VSSGGTSNRAGGKLVAMVPAGWPLSWWGGFGWAFVLTCLIELPAYLALFAALGWVRPGRDAARALTVPSALWLAFAVNCLTHPALWALSLHWPGPTRQVGLEAAVVLVEAVVICQVVRRAFGWALFVSLGANTLSVFLGGYLMPGLTGAA
jgi:hypothetical protein